MANDGIFKKAYEIVAKIPPGKVTTYGRIAAQLGNPRLARRIGQAMFGAPGHLNLPCHRVVKKDGSLCHNAEFGREQELLLKMEGVPFLPDGRVDLAQALFNPVSVTETAIKAD